MREHVVEEGESPAAIAIFYAGCPKCARDLIAANPHKPTRTYPNGYVTFRDLRAGEKLNLPDKWWSKEFDALPKSYFAALPYADGVTPGKSIGIGAPPYSDALVSAAKQADAAIAEDDNYCASVARVGSPVNSTVHAFKLAWNASQSPPVPINTGNYELPTAEAMKLVLGEAFEPCQARASSPTRAPVFAPVRMPQRKTDLSTGAVAGIALLGAGTVGGAVYLATRKRRR